MNSLKGGDEGRETAKRIFNDDGYDVTPKPLSFTPLRSRRKTSVKSKYTGSEAGASTRQTGARTTGKDLQVGFRKTVLITQPVEKDYLKELEIVKEKLRRSSKLDMEEATVKPATVTIYLEESPYHLHLSMPSTNVVKSLDAEAQTDEIGVKSRRYRLCNAAQTYNPVSKKKMSQTAPIHVSTGCVFASEWDLYDTYRRLSYEDEEAELDAQELEEIYGIEMPSKMPDDKQRPSVTSESTLSQSNEVQPIIASRKASLQAAKVVRLPEFQYAAAVAERLLASNSFHAQQLAFMATDRDSHEVATRFHYNMNELWAFSYNDSRNRIVNAVAWNTANINIVAVGYGYRRDGEVVDGLVCCWSVKNPSQPERVFPMLSSVTSLSFSHTAPSLLAVGCLSGDVILLNVSSETGDKQVLNGEEGCLRYGPVGQLQWFFHTDFVEETEEIISVGKNGRVYKWNYRESYRSYEIMKLSYFQPNAKDPTSKPHRAKNRSKNTLKYLNGLSVSLHPRKRMAYYVSTQEGSIVKCSMNRHDRIEEILPAHAGPVYGVYHSPFSAAIFCTCGSDWFICLWVDNLKQPLLKLYHTKQPVLGVSWSPIHSTILATISGPYLSMWDLARKTIVPISTVKSSTGNIFTSVQFSLTGKNILAGDVVGDVFVFNLVDMPYPPFLQEEALIRALQKALVSKPEQRSYLETLIKTR